MSKDSTGQSIANNVFLNTLLVVIARLMFIDFSSAFNTSDPLILFSRLKAMNINSALCHWILDFLRNIIQSVKVNNTISCPLSLNTGAPQGCALSSLLLSIYTNDMRAHITLSKYWSMQMKPPSSASLVTMLSPSTTRRWNGLWTGVLKTSSILTPQKTKKWLWI